MKNEDLYERLCQIFDEVRDILRERPLEPGDIPERRVIELVLEGHRIKKELDPLVRTMFRDRPSELAHWNEIAQRFADMDKGEEEQGISSDSWLTGKEEELTELRIEEACRKGDLAVRELDPLVREIMKDDPQALAEWDSIMQDYYAIDEMETDS